MSTRAIERKVMVPQRLVTAPGKTVSPEVSQLHQAVLKLAEAHNYHDDQLMRTLRGGVSASNNALVKYVTLSVQMPSEAPWQTFSLINSWANQATYVPAAYLVFPAGRVFTRGVVKGGASTVAMYANQLLAPSPNAIMSVAAGLDGAAELRIDSLGILSAIFTGTPKISLAHNWIAVAPGSPTPFPAPWPILVQHGFEQCLGLDVVACAEDSQSAHTLAPLAMPSWQDVGDGQLRLNGLWGLQWGKKYRVRLRLSAEA